MMRPWSILLFLLPMLALGNSARPLIMSTKPPVAAGGGGSVTVTHLFSVGTNTSRADYTFPAQTLGTESAGRGIVVLFGIRDTGTSATSSGVTINGVSASRVVSTNQTGGGNLTMTEAWYANVPSGTSGDIVLTFSESVLRCVADGYSVTGNVTAEYAAGIVNGTSIPMSVNGTTGGALVSFIGVPMSTTVSWTGVTENSETVAGTFTGSSASGPASAGSNSVTPTSAGSGNSAAVLISFQP